MLYKESITQVKISLKLKMSHERMHRWRPIVYKIEKGQENRRQLVFEISISKL